MLSHPEDIKAISSRQNPFIEKLRALRDDTPEELLFIEGPRLLEEVLKSNLTIEHLVCVPALLDTQLVKKAGAVAREKTQITPYVLKGLSDVEAPQGMIALVRKPITDWSRLLSRAPRPIVVLDGIQNAGNAATMIRTAEAAGAAGVITTPGSARLFTPRALRGAMGSSLRVPILEHQDIETIIEKTQTAHYSLMTTSSPTTKSLLYSQADWAKAWLLVLGQEGHGLSSEWVAHQPTQVHIPMEPGVESLNVAAAAAILLYESRR